MQARYNYASFLILSGLRKDKAKLHFIPVNVAPHLQLDINNGVLITEDEHIQFHTAYGHGAKFEIYQDTFESCGEYICLHKRVRFKDFFKNLPLYLEVPGNNKE